MFRFITAVFLLDIFRQTLRNLWHDGALFRISTWQSGWRLLMARDGMLRGNVGRWREYLRPDFHPSRIASRAGLDWLRDHSSAYRVVGEPAAPATA